MSSAMIRQMFSIRAVPAAKTPAPSSTITPNKFTFPFIMLFMTVFK